MLPACVGHCVAARGQLTCKPLAVGSDSAGITRRARPVSKNNATMTHVGAQARTCS